MPKGVYVRVVPSYTRTAKHRLPRSEEVKKKISISELGNKNALGCERSEEFRNKVSKALKGRVFSEESKKRMSDALLGKKRSKAYIDKMRNNLIKLFKDPEFKERQIKLMMGGRHVSPNKSEIALNKLINIACPDEYRFTGNYEVIIDGLCPDFFNINGKKKIILMHGNYWHKGEDTQPIIDRYNKFGYDCLIIWEKELKDREKVIEMIQGFNNQKFVLQKT